MALFDLGQHGCELAPDAYVAETAVLIGQVLLSAGASVWPCAVLRADNEPIRIGERSNVQDGAVLHTDPGYPLQVGSEVSIGHGAVLHGCQVGDHCLIGIRAVVLNGAVIGEGSLVGAGALVTAGKSFPPRSLIIGSPAKLVRMLSDDEVETIKHNAGEYVARAALYRRGLRRVRQNSPIQEWLLP